MFGGGVGDTAKDDESTKDDVPTKDSHQVYYYSGSQSGDKSENTDENSVKVHDEPDFLPPAKELNSISPHSADALTPSDTEYDDADNSSSTSDETRINNSLLNPLLWHKHGKLRWPVHRNYKEFLQSKNMTASDEAWSTEAVFGDDSSDYEPPETPNNTLETFNNNVTNNATDISSNDIPTRNYKLTRQLSFHNLKQFRKFYGRDPTRDKSIELAEAFKAFKNDPQNKVLDAHRLSKLYANKAYRHPFDYQIPKRYVPKQPEPTSSEEKEIPRNVFPHQLFPRRKFEPPMDPNRNRDVIEYMDRQPEPVSRLNIRNTRLGQRRQNIERFDKFFRDIRLVMEKVSDYFKAK